MSRRRHGRPPAPRSQPRTSPHASSPVRPSRWGLWLALIVAAAFVVRLVYLLELRRTLFFQVLIGDGRVYDDWAKQIAAGAWLGTDVFYQSPLYPYLLAVVYRLAGHHVFLVRLLQAGLGAMSCGLLGHAGRGWFNPRAGLVAAALLAIYPPAIFFDGLIQKASLDLVLGTALLALAGILLTNRRSAVLVATGIVLGLVMLNRENARVLYPVFAIWIVVAWRDVRMSTRLVRVAVLTAGVLVVLAPVAARNALVSGEWFISTSQLGPNFYIGNHAGASGTYDSLVPDRSDARFERQDATQLAEQASGHALSPQDVSDYWLDRAFDDIRAQPGAWLRLTAKKLWLTLQAAEIVDTESIEAFATLAPVLRGLEWISFGLVLPLAALGAWLTRTNYRRLALLYAIFGALVLSVVIFYVVARYRFPIVPVVLLFAATAMVELAHARTRPAREWTIGAGVAALVAAIIYVPIAGQSAEDSTFYNYGLGAIDNGRAADAIPFLERAIAIAPSSQPAQVALGTAYRFTHRPADAVAQLTQAVALHPERPGPQYALGLALVESGKPGDALDHLARAARGMPTEPQVHMNYAGALVGVGRAAEAVTEAKTAVALAPTDAAAHVRLAGILAQAGRVPDAIAEYRAALVIAPHLAEAHNDLAVALDLTGDVNGAVAELDAASRAEPSNVMIRVNEGRLLARHGRLPEAIAEFEATSRLAPDSPDAAFALGLAYAQASRWSDARSTLTTALSLAQSQHRADLTGLIAGALGSIK